MYQAARKFIMSRLLLALSGVLAFSVFAHPPSALAQQDLPPPALETPLENIPGTMTGERLGELVNRIDPNAVAQGNGYVFTVNERAMNVIYDEAADRMRVLTGIVPTDGIPAELLMRTLQANFDAALDARYAVGNGQLWSVFVHPLSSLTERDFLSGIAQTAVAAQTFGTTFTSGVFVFGGGDTADLHEDLLRQLEEASRGDDRGI
jgi:hypothetical protein